MKEQPGEPIMKTLDVRTRQDWRRWLEEHYASEAEIWLVFHKRHTGVQSLSYNASVEEALCFGWVDSLIKRLDDDRYARKFTPRTADSRWSSSNRKRYAELKKRGLLAAPGLARPPTDRSGDPPKVDLASVPPYLEERLRKNPRAKKFFDSLAPSYRSMFIAWLVTAKRSETREKRLRETIEMLAAGKKLGMK